MTEKQQEQFKVFYDPIHNSLDRFCRAISGNKMDGEDLMHDTVLVTMKHFSKITNKQAMLSYMFSVATSLNNKRFRRKKFHAEWSQEEVEAMTHQQASPDLLIEFQLIHEKLMLLPEKTRDTLLLYFAGDLKLAEIQEIQGGSLSGVKLRLKRGKEKLVSMLTDKEKTTMLYLFAL